MKKLAITLCFMLLYGEMLCAQSNLPALLKERRSGKVMFNKENAAEGIRMQREIHSQAIWNKWGGRACPVFLYKDLNNVLWNDESVKGKVTLMYFWDPESTPCIRQIPWLNKLQNKSPYANFIACTFQDSALVKEVVQKYGYLSHQLTQAQPLFRTLGIRLIPTFVLLDKAGVVNAVITGTSDAVRHEVEEKLKELKETP